MIRLSIIDDVQYYCCTDEKKSGNYIPKEKVELAKKLAQKSYDEKVLQLANVRLTQIKKLTKDCTDDEIYWGGHKGGRMNN